MLLLMITNDITPLHYYNGRDYYNWPKSKQQTKIIEITCVWDQQGYLIYLWK